MEDTWEGSEETVKQPGKIVRYDFSIKISGNVVQAREYEGKQVRGGERAKKTRRELTAEEQAANREKSGQRAKAAFMDLVNSNFGLIERGLTPNRKTVKLLTLTYAENMLDRERLHADFARFMDNLEYRLGEKILYAAVPEQQERGAWHLHVLIYCGFLPLTDLIDLWNAENGQGGLDIAKVRDVHNLGKYMGKYLTKGFGEGAEFGKKRYWASQGLKDNTEKFHFLWRKKGFWLSDLHSWLEEYIESWRQSTYEGEYTGIVHFNEFLLRPGVDAAEAVYRLTEHLRGLTAEDDAENEEVNIQNELDALAVKIREKAGNMVDSAVNMTVNGEVNAVNGAVNVVNGAVNAVNGAVNAVNGAVKQMTFGFVPEFAVAWA